MKFVNKNHERAINLKRDLDKVQREHENFISNLEKAESKSKSPTSRKAWGKFLKAGDAEYNAKEDALYRNYYNLMHKNFDGKDIEKNMLNYKDKFVDEKFINDMFKKKAKEKSHAKTKKKK